METIHTIGRRKTSVARVYLSRGKDIFTVNKKDYKEYFPTKSLQYKILQPLRLTENLGKFNLSVSVHGGGTTGQVEAIRLGICRALCKISDDNKVVLKGEGLLTRDPRMVERKKFGQKKARKKFQFSKR
ncbi:MAG: 30S ribosomal protein S9 [Flavobacteriaceae bacterium TMED212]|nr:MAG: 30S ribosomal protein S9 [Flavobacteriaceae bacterium TMED212]